MKDLVFYHAHCMDGTGAAAAYLYGHKNGRIQNTQLSVSLCLLTTKPIV